MKLVDLRRYNPDLVSDLEHRSALRSEVNYDLSPLIIRNPGSLAQKLYLNCLDATSHPVLQHAGYGRDAVQNLKRRFKHTHPRAWINWTLRKTGETLEVRLPTISETLAVIENRNLCCDEERVRSKLLERGYLPS